jgi:LysR family transcriptional regulator, low CO2-responsive transcriptional regulator
MKITIDSQHLRVFTTIARTLNMGRAAEELKLTPSAVSHCLKALEADLGARLFERSSRRVALSEAGHAFVAEAEDVLGRMKAMRRKVREISDWRQGQLRIGANATACQYILAPTLREFRESFPDYTIRIEQCSSKEAIGFLADDRIDLGVFTEPASYPGMDFTPTVEDDLQFVVNPLHPWVAKRKAIREEIPTRKLILPERSSDTYGLIEAYFREEGITLQPIIEIANEDAIKQFVRLDLGIGILPRWISAQEVKQGLLVGLPLGRRQLRRRWGVLRSKARKLSFAENVFTNICRNVLKELVAKSAA